MPKRHSIILFYVCVVFFAWISTVSAEEEVVQVPRDLAPCLEQMLELTRHDSQAQPDMAAIGTVLDHILAPKDPTTTYSAGQRGNAASNYYEFSIDRPFDEMLALTYNPKIPSYFTIPASLHQSSWIEVNGRPQPFPDLLATMRTLSDPVLIKGVEYIVNTPDTNSGAYYAYNLDRAMVLALHQGHRVLISMSTQKGKSDVGMKGLVVGSDDDWNYLYTGEKGCTLSGMGWADTYMYDSESIIVYFEMTQPVPHVRCAVFKWLDAGWAGINMAKTAHIKIGVQRFVKNMKEIVEYTDLPPISEMASMIRRIEGLSTPILQEKVRSYFNTIKARYGNDNRLNRQWFSRLSENDRYIQQMNREELIAVVCKEYLKYLLGKTHSLDTAFFNQKAANQVKQPS